MVGRVGNTLTVLVQFFLAATRSTAAKRSIEDPFLPKYPAMPRGSSFDHRHRRSISGVPPELRSKDSTHKLKNKGEVCRVGSANYILQRATREEPGSLEAEDVYRIISRQRINIARNCIISYFSKDWEWGRVSGVFKLPAVCHILV